MKKTIIAAAVAASVAAPAAFADVKISGMVAYEQFNTEDGSANSSTDTGNAYTDLVFTGSEDLGNGLKAGFKYHIYHDNGGATVDAASSGTSVAADQVADTTVSLSGDFGTIIAGRMESLAESKMDAFANIEGGNLLDLEAESSAFSSRVNNAVAYITPDINGFHAAISTFQGSQDQMNACNEVLGVYSNAGLKVMANASQCNQAAAADLEHSGIAVSYTMGDVTLYAMDTEFDVSTSDRNNDYTMYGVKYAMGNNTIAFGMNDDEVAASEQMLLSLTHSFSKNVSVIAQWENTDHDAANAADDDEYLVGMRVNF